MKKLLLITIAFFGLLLTTNAASDTCVIQGGNGASVNVTVVDWEEDGTVELSIDSDSEYHVNVRFTLSYYTKSNYSNPSTSQVFSTTAQPNQSNVKTVRIRLVNNDKLGRVSSVHVDGARCVK